MSQSGADMNGSEMAFNHGLVSDDENADLTVTVRALRVAEAWADSDNEAKQYADVRTQLEEAAQYTEAHKVVRATVDVSVVKRAHRKALEVLTDDRVAESVEDNWQEL
jgi:L-cysteine desulfidase